MAQQVSLEDHAVEHRQTPDDTTLVDGLEARTAVVSDAGARGPVRPGQRFTSESRTVLTHIA